VLDEDLSETRLTQTMLDDSFKENLPEQTVLD
jgi:hypothetical protein